jgi:hypothetical protein
MSKSEKITEAASGTTTPSAAAAEFENASSSSWSGDAETREARISKAAFFRAAARGFEPGHEWDDWLAAEKEIDAKSKGAVREGNRDDTSSAALRPDPNSRIWSS